MGDDYPPPKEVAVPLDDEECTDWVMPPPKKSKKKVQKSYGGINAPGATEALVSPAAEDADSAAAMEEGEAGELGPDGKPKQSKKAMLVSILTLCLSIPALIGAWCWPALVIGLVGGTVTASARSLGHYISFGLTLFMMAAITGYTFYTSKRRRRGNHLFQYGPTYILLMASVLVMADLVRHVMQNLEWWPAPSSSQYKPGCHDENFSCLSAVGWVFTVFCTYTGFTLLIVGTMWNADLIGKLSAIREQWRELRAQ